MQAVFLAAGRGTRMGEMTEKTPKPLLEVAGKTLLEHKFDALPDQVDEIILVIGYLGEMMRAKFGDSYKGKKITYMVQENPVGGTMDALQQAKKILNGKFLATNADDIHLTKDIVSCLGHQWALAVTRLRSLDNAAEVRVDARGNITEIVESDMHKGGLGLGNVGLYVLDPRIFKIDPVQLEGQTEYGLPQTMLAAAKTFNIPMTAIEISFWVHITSPEDLVRAEEALSKRSQRL